MSVAHGEQILVSLSAAELVSDDLPDGLALIDLGEQRLRDLSRPERIFQVVAATLPSEFPAIRTLDAFPGNLPLQVTSFVGRRDELVELSKLLHDASHCHHHRDWGCRQDARGGAVGRRTAAALPDGAWLFDSRP
jgi:hypothetical protein